MRLFIRPLDTQFYRDGRPFDAGTESEGRSISLPHPRTLYGALRACILSRHSDWQNWPNSPEVQSVIGSSPDQFGSLIMRGPMMAKDFSGDLTNICQLYSIPGDLVKAKDTRICFLLNPLTDDSSLKEYTNLQYEVYPCKPVPRQHIKEIEGYFLSHDNLTQYLTGKFPQEKVNIILEKAENVFQFEPRLGIALNPKTRTVKLDFLYSVNHIRVEDNVGLIINVDHHNGLLPEKGLFRLGGDSRPVEYTKIENEKWNPIIEDVKKRIAEEGKFKIYFITPTIFKNGWYPDFLFNQNGHLEGNLPDTSLRVRLVGACVGRAIPVGGFDIRNKHPKEIQKAVPSGSVYFFRFTDWNSWTDEQRESNISLLLKNFFYKSLADQTQPQGYWKEGFGLALIGGW